MPTRQSLIDFARMLATLSEQAAQGYQQSNQKQAFENLLANAPRTPTFTSQQQYPLPQGGTATIGTVPTDYSQAPIDMERFLPMLVQSLTRNPDNPYTQNYLQTEMALRPRTFIAPAGSQPIQEDWAGRISPVGEPIQPRITNPIQAMMQTGMSPVDALKTIESIRQQGKEQFKVVKNPATGKWEHVDVNTGQFRGLEAPQPPGDNPQNKLDKSYQYHTSQISALAKPLQDRVDRMERLQVSLDQNTPQADALIAPELLTAMAGGMGSGLRMNEAEISRIVGGRNAWESLRSTLLRFQANPDQPFLIPANQRGQIQSLIDEMNGRIKEKNNAIIEAQQKLAEATNSEEHKTIFSNLRKRLAGFQTGVDLKTKYNLE